MSSIIEELGQYGVKHHDIAALCGVTARTVRNWNAGKHPIPEEIASVLEGVLRERKASLVDEISSQMSELRKQIVAIDRNLAMLKTSYLTLDT